MGPPRDKEVTNAAAATAAAAAAFSVEFLWATYLLIFEVYNSKLRGSDDLNTEIA